MILFLKIISSPIRFLLFIVIAIISVIIYVVSQIILVWSIIASLATWLIRIIMGLAMVGVIISAVFAFINTSEHTSTQESLLVVGISFVGIVVLTMLVGFLPCIFSVIHGFMQMFSRWIMGVAKMILLLDTSYLIV